MSVGDMPHTTRGVMLTKASLPLIYVFECVLVGIYAMCVQVLTNPGKGIGPLAQLQEVEL